MVDVYQNPALRLLGTAHRPRAYLGTVSLVQYDEGDD
jgi:hypothetical protein